MRFASQSNAVFSHNKTVPDEPEFWFSRFASFDRYLDSLFTALSALLASNFDNIHIHTHTRAHTTAKAQKALQRAGYGWCLVSPRVFRESKTTSSLHPAADADGIIESKWQTHLPLSLPILPEGSFFISCLRAGPRKPGFWCENAR